MLAKTLPFDINYLCDFTSPYSSTFNRLQQSIKERRLSSARTAGNWSEKLPRDHAMASTQGEQTLGTTTVEEPSPLVELPPELRNKVYRYVLLSEGPVHVGATGFMEPPLLMTAKQIRQEASSIFYKENEFDVLIIDYDIKNCIKWDRKIKAGFRRGDFVGRVSYGGSITYSSRRDWENLLGWMKAYHKGTVSCSAARPSLVSSGQMENKILGGIFTIVAGMATMPWFCVEMVMQEQRLLLAEINSGWSE